VVTSITAGDCPRSGVHQQRERHDHGEAGGDAQRERPGGREGERVRAGHHELAVSEVDEPQHAEDEADPHRHQRIDGAEAEGVGDGLEVQGGEQHQAR
jgi:hypothetical protein